MRSNDVFIEADDAGSLMSISDMMSALLFVFIITLAAFIIKFQDATEKKDRVVDQLTTVESQRSAMLTEIKEELERRGIQVSIDPKHGVLRLKEDAIQFQSGRASLAPEQRGNVAIVGDVLLQVLPCYAHGNRSLTSCPEEISARLDSILLEGHTDNVPIHNESYASNWELSAQRAIETYRVFESDVPELLALENARAEPLFSVSGYGEGRPVVAHAKPTSDSENRRIDLRFIMAPPEIVDPQRDVLQAGLR